jgi:outer membrane protein assembly factor BamB
VDAEGEVVWQTEAGPFRSMHGYGSSPVLFEHLVIVAGDSGGGAFLAALHRETGEVVWRQRRSSSASFGTPALIRQKDHWELLHNGHESLTSYDPLTGEVLWTAEGPAKTTANTPAFLPGVAVISGGYPQRGIMGVRTDGSGEVLWRHRFKAYVPSPLVIGENVLVVQDSGVVRFYQADSGNELWTRRLSGGFSASPTLSGDYAFVPNEAGTMYVLRPTPQGCEVVAENRLAAGGFASPVICGGRLYLRNRKQLYCIGHSKPEKVEP